MKYLTVKSSLWSLIGTTGLLLFYFLTMRILAGSWETAFSQFEKLWYLMVPLAIGFGVQIGLFVNLKEIMKNNLSSKRLMAASTTTSTVGMVACCAHHLTDVLPILGLSALSVFLVSYQIPILMAGIILNLLGIVYHINIVRKISLHHNIVQ